MWLAMACLLRDQHEQWKHKYENPCRSVKIFRCQLPQNNAFYSAQPPKHDGSDKPLCPGAPVCHWCGTWKGDKICSSCKKARYCSEKHQALHWRTGHKNDCLQIISSAASNLVLPAVGIGFVRWFAKASNVHRLHVLDPSCLYSVLFYDQLTIHYLRLMALINNSKI